MALLIATYEYEDDGLRSLEAPGSDAEALADVLRNPDIAGFDVSMLVNEPHYVVGEAIGEFYRDRKPGDLAVLYFTGHGLKDDDGRLYLAMSNTRRNSLLFTAVGADQIDHAMTNCRSRQQVLVLDCCYSGAFPAGHIAKADTDVHALEQFQGRGRSVLTASDSTQYSFEGISISGGPARSVFTRHLVAGLRDGSADLDGDGNITLDELYSYVYDRVVEDMPRQRPKRLDNVEGRIVIAHNANWTLPGYLRNALGSPLTSDRIGALDGLSHLFRIGNRLVREQVRAEIGRLADDDSRMVSAAATDWLGKLAASEADRPPATLRHGAAGTLSDQSELLHAEVQQRQSAAPTPLRTLPGSHPPTGQPEPLDVPSAVLPKPPASSLPIAGAGPLFHSSVPAATPAARHTENNEKSQDHNGPRRTFGRVSASLAILASALLTLGLFASSDGHNINGLTFIPWYVSIDVVAVVAGVLMLRTTTRFQVGPGFLLGVSGPALWGLIFVAGERALYQRVLPELFIFGHVSLILAVAFAALVLRGNPEQQIRYAVPREVPHWFMIALGVGGGAAVATLSIALGSTSAVGYDIGYEADNLRAAFIVFGLLSIAVPTGAIFMTRPPLQISVLAGWISGAASLTVFLAGSGRANALEWGMLVAVSYGFATIMMAMGVQWLNHRNSTGIPPR